MIKICERFSVENSILFNKKKTICIKFGSKLRNGERAILDSSDLLWNVVHLGNYVNSACNDDVDCNIKKSFFIGYVNKLMANYGRLQTSVLINLFKSYCCSFYGSHLWKFNSTGFDKCCKSWNIAVCKLLHIPFNTHVWILGPLIKQNNLRVQLQFRNFQFLLNAFNSTNDIVKTCIQSAMYNSNTCIGYKLAFYRYKYSLDSYTTSMKIINGQNLSDYQSSIVNNLSTLIEMRSGNNFVNGFTLNEINQMIEIIATD